MNDLAHALQNGTGQLWVLIPSAVFLGALHGLEPGHSKTMMAAFIIAIRGTVMQAVLLGVSAALSHSLIIWILAGLALNFGNQWNAETAEPYLQLGSAVCIYGLAAWMFWRTRRDLHEAHAHSHHHHHPGEAHEHHSHSSHSSHHDHDHDHDHDHSHEHPHRHDHTDEAEYQDAHERAHALDIEKRFTGRAVTTSQIALFGITGGLMPCPAAFTVLLICLQLKQVTLGFALVGSFSFGLALTMVATGTLAALSVQHAQKRFRGFGDLMRRAPYISCVLLVLLATYMAIHGWHELHG